MAAVRYLLSTWRTGRVAALVGIGVLAAAALSVTVLAVLGAVRSATAWEDLRERGRAEDLLLDVASMDVATELAVDAAAIEGVESAVPLAYSYLVPDGRQEDFFGGVILPLAPGALDEVWRPVIIDGRPPEQAAVDEIVVNQGFADVTGLGVGDRFVLVDPLGLIHQPMIITGIGVLTTDFTFGAGAPLGYPTATFTTTWGSELHDLEASAGTEVVGSAVAIAGTDEVITEDLATRVGDQLPREQVRVVNSASLSAALVVDTLAMQRDGYAALAVASGAAAVAMVAVLFVNLARLQPVEVVTLRALGFRRRELELRVLALGLVVVIMGSVGAIGLAVVAEDTVPTGLAARVGAGRGFTEDRRVLALTAVGLVAALGVMVVAVATRSTPPNRSDPSTSARGRSFMRWPALALGLRFATGGGIRSARRQAVAALVTVFIVTLGISAVAVVVHSRDALRDDPSRMGKFFDVYLYTYPEAAEAQADQATLVASPAVKGVVRIDTFTVSVTGSGAAAIVVNDPIDGLEPPVVQGRLPTRDDELVLTVPFLRQLRRHVGDTVEVSGPTASVDARIVGTVVLPGVSSVAGSEQIAMTESGREAVGAKPEGYVLGVDLRDAEAARNFEADNDRLDACGTSALLEVLGVSRLDGVATGAINLCAPRGDQRATSIDELGTVPTFVVGFLLVLGTAALAFLLTNGMRGARRDIAVLRTIGFTRGQSATTLLVQAGSAALLGSLVAVPLGLALGRWAWRGLVQEIGVVVRPEVSAVGTIGVVLGIVAIAEALATPVVLRLLSRPPSEGLRAQ